MDMTNGYCDCIGEVADGADYCPDCGLEYGLPIAVTVDDYGVGFEPFEPSSTGSAGLGAQALAYVLRHGHTISVDVNALHFARGAAVNAMHGRKSDDPVVVNVSKALDLVDKSLRFAAEEEKREQAEGEQGAQAGELLTGGGGGDTPRGNRAEELRPKPKSPIGPVPSAAIKF
jgi:hypothetical protein